MREEVRSSSGAAAEPPLAVANSSSPLHTPVASSAGASSPAMQANIGRQASRVDSSSQVAAHVYHPSHSFDAAGTAMDSAPSCRPWERGDLLRRLATFKPSTWASKPKAASSLACAQRGWVNIDLDKIECESCGAHLIFNALMSWSPVEVASAGEAFAEQLDAAHQNSCPWRGNSCADSLVQLPLTQSALIGGFKDRCDGLLQFTSLPVIASSAIENMRMARSAQIDRLLSQSITFLSGVLGCKAECTAGVEIHQDASCDYSQAQKLIGLCGWEPRWLPNVQDCEENSTHSAKNAPSVGPDEPLYPHFVDHIKNSCSASAKRDKGKGKLPLRDSGCSMRSPLLDCSLCGATVRMWDFKPVLRPSRLSPNNIDVPETGRKLTLTRGISAASGINEWVADGVERGQDEGRDEAATNEGKSPSIIGVDLSLTMAGGLPSPRSATPAASERFNNGGMGRDLMIGQPTGSEVGDCETSYESRGPSSRKRNLEEGGSTADNPQDRLQHADSIEGNFIDHDGEEVDDAAQDSDVPNKKSRGFDLFDAYRPSSGAGPSRNLSFDPDVGAGMLSPSRTIDLAVERPAARDSLRASSVIAMDTVCTSEEDSMESVEYYPGDGNDTDMPSSSAHRNIEMNDVLDLNYSNHAQQSANAHAAAGSDAREIGGSSLNEGGEVINAETAPAFGRDQLSIGISGGSVGMGASHEAEIHGNAASLHRVESVVGDAELTETMGQTGESGPGPGLMDEFVPEEVNREEPHGDSQDMVSRSVGQADSGSKIYGSTKADSVESREKMGHATGIESSMRPSLSCNAGMCAGFDPAKDDVTQSGRKILTTDDALMGLDYDPGNGFGATNGENDYEAGLLEFDPVKHHNSYCPWVNGIVAAACCNNFGSSSSSSALSGWQLTIDALDTFHSLGQAQNQIMQSDSAASLYMGDQITNNRRLGRRPSVSRSYGKC